MQLSFSFQNNLKRDSFQEEDFILLPENSDAFDFCKKFFSQKDFSASVFLSFILEGEEACGKTHLLNIFAKKFDAEFLDKSLISDLNLSKVFKKNCFYIIENIEEISDEKLLLHILNSAAEANAFLVLSTNILPKFKLKDLSSRVKNILTVSIKSPSEESLKIMLSLLLSRKQIKLSKVVVDFVSCNIKRNWILVHKTAKYLESKVYEKGAVLNLSDVKKLDF